MGNRTASALVTIDRQGSGYKVSQIHGAQPFASSDPDSSRIWWSDVGVHQNLTFPVQPDPVSGMHCWHQRVTLEKAGADDRYGDIFVDTDKSHEIYKEWLAMTRPAPGPGWPATPAVVRSSAAAAPGCIQGVAQFPGPPKRVALRRQACLRNRCSAGLQACQKKQCSEPESSDCPTWASPRCSTPSPARATPRRPTIPSAPSIPTSASSRCRTRGSPS